jgi:hypothetical protein
MTPGFRSHLAAAIFALGVIFGAPVLAADDVIDRGPLTTGLIQAKLGMDMLSKEQQQVLWQRVERYAAMESFVNFCGRPSNIERRVIGAIQPCLTPVTIQEVVNRFRKHLHDKNTAITAAKSVCEEARIRNLIKEIHVAIDNMVNEVTRMCKSCIIC